MDTAAQISAGPGKTVRRKPALSHNLNGQKLGRKGRDTRARILAATQELLDGPDETAISLSAVARQTGLGMTSLYAYFSDLTALLLALLEPAMAEAETQYLCLIRDRWPDESLGAHCAEFLAAFHQFWQENSQILHLRNSMADQKDKRMTEHRVTAARPVIALIMAQMDRDPQERGTSATGMATVLYMGFERAINIVTDRHFGDAMTDRFAPDVEHYLEAEARLLELGIREYRAKLA